MHQDIASGTQGLSYLLHLVRGNRLRRRAAFDQVPAGTRPILVIHGYLGTRGSMLPLEQRLVNDGFCVFSFNLGPVNIRDIRRSAFIIHRKLERLLAQTAWQEIDIVAHSMGGLIGLYYIKKLGGHSRVRKLVTLGTPFRGTWVALGIVAALGLVSSSTWQLLPRSSFLDELHRGVIPDGVEVYSIAAARDWMCPPPATRMRGIKAITVPFGHSGLVVSSDVYNRVKSILRPGNADQSETTASAPLSIAQSQSEYRPKRLSEYQAGPSANRSAPAEHPTGQPEQFGSGDRAGDELAERGPSEVTSSSLTSRRGEENA